MIVGARIGTLSTRNDIGFGVTKQRGDAVVVNAERSEVLLNIPQVIKARTQEARACRQKMDLFLARQVGVDHFRIVIRDEGERRYPLVPNDSLNEDRCVGGAHFLATPKDFRFFLDVLTGNPEHEPIAAWSLVESSHQTGRVKFPSRSISVLEDEASDIIGNVGPSNFSKSKSRILHQGAVGEDPKVGIPVVRKSLGPHRLALVIRMPPIEWQPELFHPRGKVHCSENVRKED